MIPIKYIGKHSEHKENLYGTGVIFKKGETKLFPENIAERMLKNHPDVYVIEKIKQEAKLEKLEVAEEKKETEDDLYYQEIDAVKRSISKMPEHKLRAFAVTKFQHEFEEKTTVSEMRKYLNNKINIGGI